MARTSRVGQGAFPSCYEVEAYTHHRIGEFRPPGWAASFAGWNVGVVAETRPDPWRPMGCPLFAEFFVEGLVCHESRGHRNKRRKNALQIYIFWWQAFQYGSLEGRNS